MGRNSQKCCSLCAFVGSDLSSEGMTGKWEWGNLGSVKWEPSACTQVPWRAWDKQPGFPAVSSHAATSQPSGWVCVYLFICAVGSAPLCWGRFLGGRALEWGLGSHCCWVGSSGGLGGGCSSWCGDDVPVRMFLAMNNMNSDWESEEV